MANNKVTIVEEMKKSQETRKFQDAVNVYFSYNKVFENINKKGYLLLLLIYLIKNNGIKLINSKGLTNAELSKLKVLFSYSLKDYSGNDVPKDIEQLRSYDCCIIDFPDKENELLEIADGLGIKLDYDSHKNSNTGFLYKALNYLFSNKDNNNNNLVFILNRLKSISSLWYKENSWWAFKEICKRISENRDSDLYSQPKELRSLLINLLDAKSKNIYYPYANWNIIEYIKGDGMSENNMSFIQAADKETYYLIRLALLYNDISIPNIISSSSCITDWRGDIGFDYIVATPPYGFESIESKFRNLEIDALIRSSKDVLRKSIGIYSSSICYSQYSKSKIKELLEQDWIEKVILLPENLFSQSSIETVIVVVNKEKSRKGEVCFVDATKCYTKKGRLNILDTNKILSKLNTEDDDVKWVQSLDIVVKAETIYPKYHTIFNESNYREGDYVELKDIVERVRITNIHTEKKGKKIREKNLNKSLIECLSTSNNFEVTGDLSNTVKIEEPVILIPQLFGYPTYYIASPSDPLFVHKTIRIYKVNKPWVFPEYLCYELGKTIDIVKKEFPHGFVTESLLRFKIAFPSKNIEDQERIVNEVAYQFKLSKANELGLQEVIERMKAEYINEVRMRKHDMRPYLTNLGSIGRMMQAYISKLEGMPEIQNKLSSLVVEHKKALESLSNLVSVLSEEQTFGNAEEFDINKFFIDLGNSNDSKVSGFKLNYHVDKNAVYESAILKEDTNDDIPLYVNIAKIDFERLVTNILENARTHGFAGREDNNGIVSIFLTINSETDSFQIDFANNGNPLPEGMNKMRFGLRGEKAGQTGGTGNGGYIIKSIVEHYKGDYDVFMDGDDTVIRVLLPISRENYD